jgi:septal ring factor EnvC (AmiA/AmiB activator)
VETLEPELDKTQSKLKESETNSESLKSEIEKLRSQIAQHAAKAGAPGAAYVGF